VTEVQTFVQKKIDFFKIDFLACAVILRPCCFGNGICPGRHTRRDNCWLFMRVYCAL